MEFPSLIRVLIADDSFFMRSLIASILQDEPGIQVIGQAKDGFEAVALALKLNPNVVLMDYNMPEMNGEEATAKIISTSETPPAIIMFSALTSKGTELTMRCLNAGAVDFLAKPSGEVSFNIDSVKSELIEKIKIASLAKIFRIRIHDPIPAKKRVSLMKGPKIVVMGSSTGGPPVVESILRNLVINLAAPLVVVQHMPPKFTQFFAERLNKVSPIYVREAKEGDVLEKGVCFVAPGDWHLEIKESDDHKKTVNLTKAVPYLGLRPAINRSMISAANIYKENTLGIILTGMGNDGMEGAKEIKKFGGCMLAQSPATAVIDSMPNAIIKNNLADEILTPDEIAQRIIEFSV